MFLFKFTNLTTNSVDPDQIAIWSESTQFAKVGVVVNSKIRVNNPKYWDGLVWTNSVDPDQMPQIIASDLGLYCLPLIQGPVVQS